LRVGEVHPAKGLKLSKVGLPSGPDHHKGTEDPKLQAFSLPNILTH